jgi:hypothetical protein
VRVFEHKVTALFFFFFGRGFATLRSHLAVAFFFVWCGVDSHTVDIQFIVDILLSVHIFGVAAQRCAVRGCGHLFSPRGGLVV